MKKTYVKVSADIDEYGNKTPKAITFGDRVFEIDRVLEKRNCVSFKVGGIGERYKIRIQDKETYLFWENDRWFVEEK